MQTDFQNSFTDGFISKFANALLKCHHIKRVTTLPCEISCVQKLVALT